MLPYSNILNGLITAYVLWSGSQKWYLVTKTVLTYCEKKNCSSNQEKLLKFKAEGLL